MGNEEEKKHTFLRSRNLDDTGNKRKNSSKIDLLLPKTRKDKGHLNATIKNTEQMVGISMRLIHQSIFVFVHPFNDNPPYRIENRSINHVVYFRQRGCQNHPWNSLSPGETLSYTWEEPMKTKKLSVRVGNQSSHVNNIPFRGNKEWK